MSHLLYWPETEGLICAVSKVNIRPQSKILYEDWTEHYRNEFSDWDLESDPVVSNPNFWDYGMRWDDDEKEILFKGKIVYPTAVFKDVVVAIHYYGHPRVEKTVENFDVLPTIGQGIGVISQRTLLEFFRDVVSVKLRRQGVATNLTRVNLFLIRNIPSHPLQLTSVKCPIVCRSPLGKKWTILWSSSAVKPGMYWQYLVKKRDWTVRMLLL